MSRAPEDGRYLERQVLATTPDVREDDDGRLSYTTESAGYVCREHAVVASVTGTCGRCEQREAAAACPAFVKAEGDQAALAWQTCATCGTRRSEHGSEAQRAHAAELVAGMTASLPPCGHRSCRGYLVEGLQDCRYPINPPMRDDAPSRIPAELREGHAYLQRDAKPTSAAAAAGVTLRGGTQRVRVLEAIVDSASDGMGLTDEEGQQLTSLHPNSYTARRLELVEAGYVEDTGDTRPTSSGQRAVVWLPTLQGCTALELAKP